MSDKPSGKRPDFVLLADSDHFSAPPESPCPTCGKSLTGPNGCRTAYLSGGALPESKISLCALIGFLSAGVLNERDGVANPDIAIVQNLKGGQFALQWCSVPCMREWFLKLFAEIESLSQPNNMKD
jgi:hypothetical protein